MNHNHSNTRHMLLMIACCLIPIVLIFAVTVFGISLGSLTPLLPYALVLLCPLMMIFMMRDMGHEHHGDAQHSAHESRAGRTAQITEANQAVLGDKATASSQKHRH